MDFFAYRRLKKLKPGDKVKFSCPVCAADLTSPRDKNFAELMLIVPGHEPRRVEFNRQFGTHATFVIDGEDVTSFGEDAKEFGSTNFFGA